MSVETIYAGCAFQGREYVVESFEVVQLWFFEVFFRGACGCWRVCAWSREYACAGVAEVADGVDERPHGHRFPVGGLVVVECDELTDDVIWQVGVGRVADDAPGVGVGG